MRGKNLTLFTGYLLISLGLTGITSAAVASNPCDRACLFEKAESLMPQSFLAKFPEMNGGRPHIKWSSDSKQLSYSVIGPQGATLYLVDTHALDQKQVITAAEIATVASEETGTAIYPFQIRPRAINYDFQTGKVNIKVGDASYHYDVTSKKIKLVNNDASANAESVSPDEQYAIFTTGDDLFLRHNETIKRLTDDGSKWRSFSAHMATSAPNDKAPSHQKKPKIHWIGNGPNFYIERWDNRNVGEAWQINALSTPRPTLVTQKFAYAGEDNLPIPELWIFNAETAAGYRVNTKGWDHIGNMDFGGGGIWPSRDGKSLYFSRMSRGYNQVELCKVDIASGTVTILIKEQGDLPTSIRAAEFHALNGGFLWKSDKDGYPHYYLHTSDGKLVRQVTDGSFAARKVLHVDETNNRLTFIGHGNAATENPYYSYSYSADISKSGTTKRLDKIIAAHRPTPSPDGRFYADTYTRTDLPPQLYLKDSRGNKLLALHTPDTIQLSKSGWHAPLHFEVAAADGKTPLFGTIWLPRDFDSEKKYPVISHVYPGPQGETPPFGSFRPFHQNAMLAELGFIVVASGHRGGASVRGKAYQQYVFEQGNMRDYALADSKHVLEELAKTRPYMDMRNIGIYGHSGGGLMSTSALLKYPDFYKVAVSSAGNHDNNIYEMNSGEFHFGHPITGPSGSKAGYATNAELAKNLKGHLLLIQGDMDNDVHTAHTMRLLRAFLEVGKKVDLALLPGEGHYGFSKAAGDFYRLRLWDYFLEHLSGVKASSPDLVPAQK